MDVSGLLNWGGALALAAVAWVKWRPDRRWRARVHREPIALDQLWVDLVRLEQELGEEVAMDGGNRGERPMALTTQMPTGVTKNGAATPPTGLPAEQLYTWLEWVQDDLRRVETRIEYLEAARSQLAEQERLLSELLRTSGPLTRS